MINGNDFLKEMYPNKDEEQYQSSGLDLKLGQIYEVIDKPYKVNDYGLFIDEKHSYDLRKVSFDDGYLGYNRAVWSLLPNKPYFAEVDEKIEIGDCNAQAYFPRSTLIRNGVNVYTAWGDLGYHGKLMFLIINHGPRPFVLEKGVRFVQLVDFQVKDSSIRYDGDYQEDEEEDVFDDDELWTGNRIQF